MNDITNRKTEDNDGLDIEAPKINTSENEEWLKGERERLIEISGLSAEELEGIELARRLEAGEDIDIDDDGGVDDDDPAPAPVAAVPTPEPALEAAPEAQIPDPVVDLGAIKAAAKEELKALRERWTNGEATDEEFDAEQDRITDARIAAERQAVEDARAAAIEAAEQAKHQARANAFMADARAYAASNPTLFSPEHITSYDTYVRAVTSDPGNAKLTNGQMLAMAHEMYANAAQARGVTIPLPAGRRAAPRAAPKPELPPSIARIPAAAPNTAGDNGRLQTLQRQILEADANTAARIMGSLSPEDQNALLQTAF